MLKESDRLPPEEQKLYVLLADTGGTNYEATQGWKSGTVLKRISKWLNSNGCGRHLKQAYFVLADSNDSYGQIAWNDHVKELVDEPEVKVKILPPDPPEEYEQLALGL